MTLGTKCTRDTTGITQKNEYASNNSDPMCEFEEGEASCGPPTQHGHYIIGRFHLSLEIQWYSVVSVRAASDYVVSRLVLL